MVGWFESNRVYQNTFEKRQMQVIWRFLSCLWQFLEFLIAVAIEAARFPI